MHRNFILIELWLAVFFTVLGNVAESSAQIGSFNPRKDHRILDLRLQGQQMQDKLYAVMGHFKRRNHSDTSLPRRSPWNHHTTCEVSGSRPPALL